MSALWFETALLPGGWARGVRVVHAGGLIVSVETGAAPGPDDERAAIAVPGVGNLHSHAFQRGMAGLAETRSDRADSFWTWREVMYRFVGRLTPDDVRAVAAMAYAEMLESGFTRVGEFHYLHHDVDGRPYAEPARMAAEIAAAAELTGIGLTLLPVFYAHGGFGALPPAPLQQRFVNNLDGFARLLEGARGAVRALPDAKVGVAPHSLRAVTAGELEALFPLAEGGPVHIHIAEQTAEVEACLAWSAARPAAWLLDNAPVDARWCLVHATHMDAAETAAVARSGAVVGLCPITEANLGDGVFPAAALLAAGGRFGVGSDSNVLIDLAEELRLLEYGQRLTGQERIVVASGRQPSAGASLFEHARVGAAQALGAGSAEIAPGASCDLVALDGEHPALAGRSGDGLLDGWIFAARGGAVERVWRRGVKVVDRGRHLRRSEIVRAYRQVVERVA